MYAKRHCPQHFTSQPLWNESLLLMRVLTAVMIFPHSLELFDAKAMKDLYDFLTDIKTPHPVFMGHLAKITELTGSIMLALGLFTRLITIPLMVCMAVVTAGMCHWDIFDCELSSLFFFLFLFFFLQGPGKVSLDYLVFERKRKSPKAF